MSDKRKASDVLLDLEGKIDKIGGVIIQLDLNVKTILNKLNIADATIAEPPSPPKQKLVLRATAKPVTDSPVTDPPVPTMDDVTFPQAEQKKRRSVVEQRVIYNDGRPVILANVTISEVEVPTNIIDKVVTDSHGKWHSQLFGGKYIIEVKKGPTSAKRPFQMEYEIEIPGNGRPLSLDRKQVE